MENTQQKLITIVDPQRGILDEKIIERKPADSDLGALENLQAFREAATTQEFPTLLLSGLKQILFSQYAALETTFQDWVQMTTSDKPAEDWLEMNSVGTLPIVPEGTEYPKLSVATDRTVRVSNSKRGAIFEITREMIKFDRTNQMKQYPSEFGNAAKQTQEKNAYSVLTNTANYVRNSTTGDNDVGANTAATTFSGSGLELAFGVLRTMQDRKSGRYLGVNPSLLIVTPRLEFAAKQLLLSTDILRAGRGTTSSPAQEIYGTGSANPFRGQIKQILVTPWLGTSYQWSLMEPKKAVVFQEVEPLNLLIQDVRSVQNEAYFLYDVIRYRVDLWYGLGMINDRFAYYSSSSTAPSIA